MLVNLLVWLRRLRGFRTSRRTSPPRRRPTRPDLDQFERREYVADQVGGPLLIYGLSVTQGLILLDAPLDAPLPSLVERSAKLPGASTWDALTPVLPLSLTAPELEAAALAATSQQELPPDDNGAAGLGQEPFDALGEDLAVFFNLDVASAARRRGVPELDGAPLPSTDSGGGSGAAAGRLNSPASDGGDSSGGSISSASSAAPLDLATAEAKAAPEPGTRGTDASTPATNSTGSTLPTGAGRTAGARGRPALLQNYGRVPLSFEPNRGQVAAPVQFVSRGRGYGIFLTPTESVLVLNKPVRPIGAPTTAPTTHRAVLRVQLVGANPAAQATPLQPLPGRTNYYKGNNPALWRTGIAHHARVRYDNVYPGVQLVYYGTNQSQLEFDFVVAPGANPGLIRLGILGAASLRLDAQGHLILSTPAGDVIQRAPFVYQVISGVQRPVSGRYVLTAPNLVGFQVGPYDTTKPLFIDPILLYSTYLGGSQADEGAGIAVDGSGNVYVTGWTESPDFPVPPSSVPVPANARDTFVTKLSPGGTQVLYTTLLGGSAGDEARGIAVDRFDNTYVI